MTKPHTTLSEAVRAMELPKPKIAGGSTALLSPWELTCFNKGAIAARSAAANLVEQHEAQAQPTLAATQAADAKMVDMILRDVAELEYTGLEDDTMEVTPADLRLIIERHMSPTTTRSE